MLNACQTTKETRIEFEGQMDTVRCEELETDVRCAVAQSSMTVVFDLAQVDFVSSSFLRLCLTVRQQAGGRGFRIVNVCPPVKRVFKIAGLDMLLADS